MKKLKQNGSEEVTELITNFENNIKATFQAIREAILATDYTIAEQVKWNSPSFYYTGEMKPFDPKEYKRDLVVCNFHRGKILLVFPTGAKVNSELKSKDYTDGRKIISINDLENFKAKENLIQKLVLEWLRLIDK